VITKRPALLKRIWNQPKENGKKYWR